MTESPLQSSSFSVNNPSGRGATKLLSTDRCNSPVGNLGKHSMFLQFSSVMSSRFSGKQGISMFGILISVSCFKSFGRGGANLVCRRYNELSVMTTLSEVEVVKRYYKPISPKSRLSMHLVFVLRFYSGLHFEEHSFPNGSPGLIVQHHFLWSGWLMLDFLLVLLAY
ncbi:hypothetical protein PS880_00498 [Pseudomonas fluorescens]|uniref:Uncharacterized protein n=1 Tax=Pseudomonas fluorescens TaxID=294 RepID=A0A5E7H2P5_PSEFL|nr:hypothetical protein PS880_00498 [Pseudomonas fluorescens]